ncbi:hypothetical protein D9M71_672710 [compost metagenome]
MYKNRQIQVTEGFPHHIKFRRIELQAAEVGTASDQALGAQLCASVTYFSRRRFRCIERCMSPEHQAIRRCGAVLGQRVVDGAGEWHSEFGFSPIHVAMGRDGNHLQVLPCGIHTGQAHFWVSPARKISFKLGTLAGAHGRLTLWRSETQNPITYTQLDIAVGVLLEERPPVRVLVVIARVGCVGV